MRALLVVDMLNDFVTGAVRNEARALRIVPAVRRLIDHARSDADWLVVYASDAHRADDHEVEVMGRHAMAGTLGGMVIEQLAPQGLEREIVLGKRFYGAFDGTDLDDTLYDYEVSDVVITGQHLHSGILHTAYGAFCAGYGIYVPVDAVCGLKGMEENGLLDRMRLLYGAELTTSTALVGRPVLRTASSRA